MPTAYSPYHDTDMEYPTCRKLRETRIRCRRPHSNPLGCGHTIKPGEWYTESVWIVDGEFTVDTGECDQCWDEIRQESIQYAAEDSLECTADIYVDDWGGAATHATNR